MLEADVEGKVAVEDQTKNNKQIGLRMCIRTHKSSKGTFTQYCLLLFDHDKANRVLCF